MSRGRWGLAGGETARKTPAPSPLRCYAPRGYDCKKKGGLYTELTKYNVNIYLNTGYLEKGVIHRADFVSLA
jgi:hypothetical protein